MAGPDYEYLHTSMAGSYWIPCETLVEGDRTTQIRYWDDIPNEHVTRWVDVDRLRGNRGPVTDLDHGADHDLDLLRDHVNKAYQKTQREVNVPWHTCPLINEIIEALRASSDPTMAALEDKLEEVRAANLQLRLVGQRYKKLANSFRYRVVRYHGGRS